jgi:hypothetical protein
MEGEGVIAASIQDIGRGKRYDLGQDMPQSLTRGLFRFAKNLLPLAAALLLLPACSSDDEPQVAPVGGKITLTVTAGTADTRTLYNDDDYNVDDDTYDDIAVTWNNGAEAIGAVYYTGTTPTVLNGPMMGFTFTGTGTGTKSMTFTGSITQSTGALADHYNYYYPGNYVGDPMGSSNVLEFQNPTRNFGDPSSGQQSGNGTTDHLTASEVMYTPVAVKAEGSSTTTGSNIQFKHANALLRFDLTLLESVAIRALVLYASDGSTPFFSNTTLTFNDDATGSVTAAGGGESLGQLYLPIASYTAINQLKAYMMVPPVANLSSKKLRIVASTADGTHYQSNEITTDTGDELEGGKVYTFVKTLTEVAPPVFAGSNIYWDGSKLTFDDAGDDTNAAAQGIFFKRFSLIGISPASGQTSSTMTTYTPTYNTGNPSGSTWAPGTQSYSSITPIEDLLPDDFFNNEMDLKTSAEIDEYYAQSQGDICRYLSATGAAPGSPAVQWRMPTRNELNPDWFKSSQVWTTNGGGFTAQTLTDAAGLATITSGYTFKEKNTFFPASGYCSYNGASTSVGRQGNYFTANPNINGVANLRLSSANAQVLDSFSSNSAFPVRCVKVQ